MRCIMSREQKAPVGSRWQAKGDCRVFVVTQRRPFGQLTIKQEDREYFGETYQKIFLKTFTRLPDPPSKEMKPLFLPLYTEHFNAFESGIKDTEFRMYGSRYNERTCFVGREVTLSHGFGKKRRLYGVIAAFERSAEPTKTEAWINCYGDKPGDAACIRVKLKIQQ